MSTETGTSKKEIKIVPIGPGEAHLQNEIVAEKCYICGKEKDSDMALMNISDKKMSMVCLDHKGVIQEFLRQFKVLPLGWVKAEGV